MLEIDRRKYYRGSLMAQVHVKQGRIDYVFELVNVSEGGALFDIGTLQAPAWMQPGRRIRFCALLENFEEVVLHGDIAHVQHDTKSTAFGVSFVTETAQDEYNIGRLMRRVDPMLSPSVMPPPGVLEDAGFVPNG